MNASLIPVLAVVTVLFHFVPVWMRPDLFFAVTVDPAFRRSKEGTRILHFYRIPLWIGTFAAIGLFEATGFAACALLAPAGFLAGFLWAHRRTLPHAVETSPILEVDLAAPVEKFPGGPVVALLPVASLVALAMWANRHWEQIPLKIPVHWGVDGPNRFIERSTLSVYGLIALDAVICLSFVLVAWGILHWSRRVSTSGAPAASERSFRRLNVQMLLLITYFAAAMAWMMLLNPDAIKAWWAFVLLAALAPCMVLLVRKLRAGGGAPVGDRTPDSCWKLGLFYVNPKDPSIFIAKRFGIGYTFNFGNRWSWAVLGVVLAGIFARAILK